MGQRPGAIQESNVSREASDNQPMQQSDQATVPLAGAVLVPGAEAGVQTQPGHEAAGHLQNDGHHPAEHRARTLRAQQPCSKGCSSRTCASAIPQPIHGNPRGKKKKTQPNPKHQNTHEQTKPNHPTKHTSHPSREHPAPPRPPRAPPPCKPLLVSQALTRLGKSKIPAAPTEPKRLSPARRPLALGGRSGREPGQPAGEPDPLPQHGPPSPAALPAPYPGSPLPPAARRLCRPAAGCGSAREGRRCRRAPRGFTFPSPPPAGAAPAGEGLHTPPSPPQLSAATEDAPHPRLPAPQAKRDASSRAACPGAGRGKLGRRNKDGRLERVSRAGTPSQPQPSLLSESHGAHRL